MSRVLEAAMNAMWAMEPSALDRLMTIAERANDTTPEALEAYRAENMKRSERARVRDGVAIIEATGPLFKRANMLDAMSGATSYEVIRRDFQAALDDPKIKAVLFDVNSPGGEVHGTAELAQAIFEARGVKPIHAYVGGMGASAAYWLISAADHITIDETAILGSIGVQWSYRDGSEAEAKRGVKTYRFISSQSPMKNADPGSEDGAAAIRAAVDAQAQVFVETIARNRGVATETVLKDFGQGGIFVGRDAVQAGLADSIGSFESALAELAGGRRKSNRNKGTSMSETNDKPEAQAAPVDVAKIAADAAAGAMATERSRIAGLNKVAMGHEVDAAALSAAIEDGSTVEAFAVKVAESAAAKRAETKASALNALKTDEKDAEKVGASDGVEAEELTGEAAAEAQVQHILAAAKAAGVHA